MTTLFREIGDDLVTTPEGEEDEVDIYFERVGGDIVTRETALDMGLPAAGSVVPPATVYDPATGENVIGTHECTGGGNTYSGELDVAVDVENEISVAVEVT